MQRQKTRVEISSQLYVNKNDIRRLMGVSFDVAREIYTRAEEIDKSQKFRIYPTKVKITSVCKVTGFTLESIRKQALNDSNNYHHQYDTRGITDVL